MSYETLLEITQNRRSIRKFTDKPVSREDIKKIVEIGMMAPSGFNGQMWEMVVVDESELRNQITDLLLAESAKTSKGFASAPVYLLMYADERIRKYGPAARVDNDAWWEFTLNASMSCSFMSMQLAASSLGLGTMWVSAFRNPAIDGPAKEILDIPSHLQIYEMLAIGYPGMKAGKKKMRELSDTLHFNRAENYRTQADLDLWF